MPRDRQEMFRQLHEARNMRAVHAERRAEEARAQQETEDARLRAKADHQHRWSDWQTDEDEWDGMKLLVPVAHQVRHCTDRACPRPEDANERRELRPL